MKARDLDRVLAIAGEAARLVMEVYAAPFEVELKGEDDPVTRADKEANALILERLARDFPGVPAVAEESDPSTFAGAFAAPEAWFVDPLDGTREFVAKNGEFCVMIGLARGGRSVAGVVVCPALGRSFAGSIEAPSVEIAADGSRRAIRVSSCDALDRARCVVSRSRGGPRLDAALTALGMKDVRRIGSSGVKAALVACGEADVYLQPGYAGKRWDSCAPEAIVHAAGGRLTEVTGAPFDYASGELDNARGLVAANAELHAAIIATLT